MASTSTNKQPLLVDRPFHVLTDLTESTVENNVSVDIGGSNSANLVLDCTKNDGAVIDCVYAISRQVAAKYNIYLYLSPANDFLRSSQAYFVGAFQGETTEGTKTYWSNMPFVLAPLPNVGSEQEEFSEAVQCRAFYVPKGQALWAAVEKQAADDTASAAPLIGVQGGYF